ncbi:methyltransferase [Mesorhizobium sp. Root157]|uniref:class I SAM-dependent methyltransferase n=1 Tax=Mesorhizobium sp. Root157 TaxID=1736477 RepID=UPI0006F58E9B|nr:class I SAM-dependent methyltransferase [Mesorhizobium sp. Root157]KQZ94010.1 methyltransferase [Mesorhizobium sp. Root157]
MASEALKTLFHPFETDALGAPAKGARALFFGAEPGFRLPDGFDAELHCVQGFRPHYRALQAARQMVTPRAEGEGYAAAFVLAGRYRGQNELWIAEALERVVPGGLILVAGSKDDGIASLRKRIDAVVPLEGSLPKYHGVAFWLRRPPGEGAAADLRAANPAMRVEERFNTAPGMFSFEKIDAGSKLLVDNLPADIRGSVADFCCGWGLLAAEVAARSPGISALDLYEAGFEALEAAKTNVEAKWAPRFFWLDLIGEAVEGRYDWIVMNPPFHQGRAAEPDIGISLIKVAAKALKSGGRLAMVANRQLPYEAVLAASFSSASELARDNCFKVLLARR